MMKNGRYRTKAGSIVEISGKYSSKVSVEFDWFEEIACCDCRVNPYPDDGRLTWSCEYCGGGSAELTKEEVSECR